MGSVILAKSFSSVIVTKNFPWGSRIDGWNRSSSRTWVKSVRCLLTTEAQRFSFDANGRDSLNIVSAIVLLASLGGTQTGSPTQTPNGWSSWSSVNGSAVAGSTTEGVTRRVARGWIARGWVAGRWMVVGMLSLQG